LTDFHFGYIFFLTALLSQLDTILQMFQSLSDLHSFSNTLLLAIYYQLYVDMFAVYDFSVLLSQVRTQERDRLVEEENRKQQNLKTQKTSLTNE
jgi:hypothetical protein